MSCLCPACGASVPDEGVEYPSKGDNPLGLERIVECPRCGFGFASPMPEEEALNAFYEAQAYWDDKSTFILDARSDALFIAQAEARWRYINAWCCSAGGGRSFSSVLDIGAGHGYFGLVAQECIRLYAMVEPDPGMRAGLEAAWPRHEKGAALSTTADLEGVDGLFDLVVLSQVLEHVANPVGFLKRIRGLVADDGLLFVELPNRDDGFKYDTFPHVLFFDGQSLRKVMKESGFAPMHVAGCGNYRHATSLNPDAGPVRRYGAMLINMLKGHLPAAWQKELCRRFFAMDAVRDDGIWLRALGGKSE